MHFENLPNELILHVILSISDLQDHGTFIQTSKRVRATYEYNHQRILLNAIGNTGLPSEV